MKKNIVSLLLALVMCLCLLPVGAAAAEAELPDWYFLFAIFKNVDADVKDGNGKIQHVTYAMPQEEVDLLRDLAAEFEEYMNSFGIMRAHVEVAEIDTAVTELYSENKDQGSYILAEQAAPFLESKIDLDRYDHVTCFHDLTVWTSYAGITSAPFENGTGISSINHQNWEHFQESYDKLTEQNDWHIQLYVHEFLHFGEHLNRKWDEEFVLHRDGKTHYVRTDDWKTYYTDALLNRLQDLDVFPEGGTGVHPAVWKYPPHVLRTMTELNIPAGVTSIGHDAFLNYANLTSVTIPSSVTYLDISAFHGCTGLTNVSLPASVTTIADWAFANCSALTGISIPSGVTSIGRSAFQDCVGLTNVTLSSGVTCIGDWAFGCYETRSALERVSIPASVASIGYAAFYNNSLTDVYYGGTEEQWKAIQIGEYNETLTRANIHYNHLMADVKTDDWFAKGVTWAVENGITAGTGAGKFSPNSTCAQAQILTFLWRAYGSPEPSGKVSGSEYYAVPLQWAREQGVISGSLDPNSPCTRADVVTYLWRLAGSPTAKAASFSDVPASASYAGAVSWAVEQGITSGTSATTFGPNSACTRGQIVTFLRQALAG